MARYLSILFGLIVLPFLSFTSLAKELPSELLKVGLQHSYPTGYLDKDQNIVGVFPSILACVSEKTGLQYEIELFPRGRTFKLFEYNRIDAMLGSRKEELEQYSSWSEYLIKQTWTLYGVNETSGSKEPHISKQKIIGVKINSNKYKQLKRDGFENIKAVHSVERLLTLLVKNRVDYILESNLIFETALQRSWLKLGDFTQQAYKERRSGLFIHQNYLQNRPEFMQRFNSAIVTCR